LELLSLRQSLVCSKTLLPVGRKILQNNPKPPGKKAGDREKIGGRNIFWLKSQTVRIVIFLAQISEGAKIKF